MWMTTARTMMRMREMGIEDYSSMLKCAILSLEAERPVSQSFCCIV